MAHDSNLGASLKPSSLAHVRSMSAVDTQALSTNNQMAIPQAHQFLPQTQQQNQQPESNGMFNMRQMGMPQFPQQMPPSAMNQMNQQSFQQMPMQNQQPTPESMFNQNMRQMLAPQFSPAMSQMNQQATQQFSMQNQQPMLDSSAQFSQNMRMNQMNQQNFRQMPMQNQQDFGAFGMQNQQSTTPNSQSMPESSGIFNQNMREMPSQQTPMMTPMDIMQRSLQQLSTRPLFSALRQADSQQHQPQRVRQFPSLLQLPSRPLSIPRLSHLAAQSTSDTTQTNGPAENLPENPKLPRSLSQNINDMPHGFEHAALPDAQSFAHPELMAQFAQPNQMNDHMISMPNPMMPHPYEEAPLQSDQSLFYSYQ